MTVQALKFFHKLKKFAPEHDKKHFDVVEQALEELEQYRALGTVEELKEAREKQVAKKPNIIIGIDNQEVTLCPNCNGTIRGYQQHYCDGCGQALVVDDGGTSKAGGIE